MANYYLVKYEPADYLVSGSGENNKGNSLAKDYVWFENNYTGLVVLMFGSFDKKLAV